MGNQDSCFTSGIPVLEILIFLGVKLTSLSAYFFPTRACTDGVLTALSYFLGSPQPGFESSQAMPPPASGNLGLFKPLHCLREFEKWNPGIFVSFHNPFVVGIRKNGADIFQNLKFLNCHDP